MIATTTTITIAIFVAALLTYLHRYDKRHGWHSVSVVALDHRHFIINPRNAYGEALPSLRVDVLLEVVSYLSGELASPRHSDRALDLLDNHLRSYA